MLERDTVNWATVAGVAEMIDAKAGDCALLLSGVGAVVLAAGLSLMPTLDHLRVLAKLRRRAKASGLSAARTAVEQAAEGMTSLAWAQVQFPVTMCAGSTGLLSFFVNVPYRGDPRWVLVPILAADVAFALWSGLYQMRLCRRLKDFDETRLLGQALGPIPRVYLVQFVVTRGIFESYASRLIAIEAGALLCLMAGVGTFITGFLLIDWAQDVSASGALQFSVATPRHRSYIALLVLLILIVLIGGSVTNLAFE